MTAGNADEAAQAWVGYYFLPEEMRALVKQAEAELVSALGDEGQALEYAVDMHRRGCLFSWMHKTTEQVSAVALAGETADDLVVLTSRRRVDETVCGWARGQLLVALLGYMCRWLEDAITWDPRGAYYALQERMVLDPDMVWRGVDNESGCLESRERFLQFVDSLRVVPLDSTPLGCLARAGRSWIVYGRLDWGEARETDALLASTRRRI